MCIACVFVVRCCTVVQERVVHVSRTEAIFGGFIGQGEGVLGCSGHREGRVF